MELKKRLSINILIRAYYDAQKTRIALDGQIGTKKDGSLKKNTPDRELQLLAYLLEERERVYEREKNLEKIISKQIKGYTDKKTKEKFLPHPLWENFLKDIKGVGPIISAVIITEFNIYEAPTASNLVSFAGLATGLVNGKKWNKKKKEIIITSDMIPRDKKTKGYLCPYNQFLKAKLIGVLGSSFIIQKSSYSKIYYDTKHRLESKDWGIASKNPVNKKRPKAGHQHNAAIRKMVKIFLQDLYAAWRKIEELPVREPYKEEYQNKVHNERAMTNEKSNQI